MYVPVMMCVGRGRLVVWRRELQDIGQRNSQGKILLRSNLVLVSVKTDKWQQGKQVKPGRGCSVHFHDFGAERNGWHRV